MTIKHVQLYGGVAATVRVYVGPDREVVVDTSNHDLLLMDGVTPGGHRIPSLANLQTLFQAKSTELAGLSFQPSQFGILVRKTPGSFALRTLTVNPNNLTLSNGSGVGGNPTFGLKPVIESSHTFSQPVTGNGGFVGALTGNSAGTHVGPSIGAHTGDVTGDVTGDLTGNSFGIHFGGADFTGEELVFDSGQVPYDALDDETKDKFVQRGIPAGGIIMWHGSLLAIPEGWFLCDGTNGTPNLTDRFIVGQGSTFTHLSTGGDSSHTHDVTNDTHAGHTHTLDIAGHALSGGELPSHRHSNGVTCTTANVFNRSSLPADPNTGDSIDINGAAGTVEGFTSDTGGGATHTHAGSTANSSGGHTHVADVSIESHVPPYFALAFIMKGV